MCDQCGKTVEGPSWESPWETLKDWMEVRARHEGLSLWTTADICSYECLERYGKRLQEGKR